MIIILFRGREIPICHLPSTLPGWEVGISKDNQPPAMLRMELADGVPLGHAPPAGRLQRDFPPSCNSSRQGGGLWDISGWGTLPRCPGFADT